jgi:ion channel-forming bestrophin family protein
MHTGKLYKLSDFIFWTRRHLLILLAWSTIVTVLYEVAGLRSLSIPWSVAALVGTATAFIVGFKNVQTYNRTWEARQIWGEATAASRAWAMMCRDYIADAERSRKMINVHLAWLAALRYQLRASSTWESTAKAYNLEYNRRFKIPEREIPLETELLKYISQNEVQTIITKSNKATQLLALQGEALKNLYDDRIIENSRFAEMHKQLREFTSHQGKSERIKNFPYPRQYATMNNLLIKLFCIILPFALLGEFDALNENNSTVNLVWLVIPFSTLVSWIYTSLEQVGESTENPFEGSANDIPITQMSRTAEIDIKEMLGDNDLPPALQPENEIVM